MPRLYRRTGSSTGSSGSGAGGAPGKRTRTASLVQRARDRDGLATDAAPAVAAAAEADGQPLPSELADRFSASLGMDLADVRVHTGPASADAAEAIGALAYTDGDDIHFGAGQFQPDTPEGQHLIAHEVAHTAQQANGSEAPQAKLEVSASDDPAEAEADRAADAMVAGAPAHVTAAVAGLRRQTRPRGAPPTDPIAATPLAVPSDLDRLPPAVGANLLRPAIGDAASARIATAGPTEGRAMLREQLTAIERRVRDSHDGEALRLWQQAATATPDDCRTMLPRYAAAGQRANQAVLTARLAPERGASSGHPDGAAAIRLPTADDPAHALPPPTADEAALEQLLASDELPAMAMVDRALAALIARPEFAVVPSWHAPMLPPPAAVHLLCAGEGRRFDLHLTIAAAHRFHRALRDRLAADEPGDATAEDDFSRAFNTSFANILAGLRTAGGGADAAAPTAAHRYRPRELARLFTAAQRQALAHYMATREIPDRLFTGDHQGGLNPRQRLLIAGAILSHGHYRPGSHMQAVHARMCGHYVRLVHTYAGVGVEGIGADQHLDLSGALVVGDNPQGSDAAGAATRLPMPDDPVHDLRRRHDARFPFEKFVAFQPGDWLFVFTNTNTVDGNHSIVFAGWLGPLDPRTRTGRARIFHQPSEQAGGTEGTMVLGDVDRPGVHRVTRHLPLGERAAEHVPQTVEELVRSFDPNHRNPAAARANAELIREHERRLRGHLDVAALTRELQRRNREYLGHLATLTAGANPVMSTTQLQLWEAANRRDELTDLIQLCTHLQAYAYTASAAGTAERRRLQDDDRERERDDRRRVEPALARAREQLADAERRLAALAPVEHALEAIVAGLAPHAPPADHGHARRPRERASGRSSPAAQPALVREAIVADRPRLLGELAGLGIPEAVRPAVAAYVQQVAAARQQHGLARLGRGLSLAIAQRTARDSAATSRRQIDELEHSRRYHIAQIMSAGILHGVQQTGATSSAEGGGATRVPHTDGLLAHVVPALPWDQLIVPGFIPAPPRARPAGAERPRHHGR